VTRSARTIVGVVLAALVIAGTSVSWYQGAQNQALGGDDFRRDVVLDLVMALAGPAVFALTPLIRRGRGDSVADALPTACKAGVVASLATWPFLALASFPV
jgi:hypothetical protein